MPDHQRMYKDLAWTWPIISPPEDYEEEANQFREAISGHSRIPVKTLLDIGCGGGHIDSHLKRHFKVTGVDLNEGMLANARKLNPEVRYLRGDMRNLRFGEKFDSVIIADSITYMCTKEDLLAAFQTAFEHLKPGGVFCTYAEEWKGKPKKNRIYCRARKKGNIEITLIEDYYDPDPEDTTFDCTFVFLIRESRYLRIEFDQHRCGIFPLRTWKETLEDAGFAVSQMWFRDEDECPMFVGARPLE